MKIAIVRPITSPTTATTTTRQVTAKMTVNTMNTTIFTRKRMKNTWMTTTRRGTVRTKTCLWKMTKVMMTSQEATIIGQKPPKRSQKFVTLESFRGRTAPKFNNNSFIPCRSPNPVIRELTSSSEQKVSWHPPGVGRNLGYKNDSNSLFGTLIDIDFC